MFSDISGFPLLHSPQAPFTFWGTPMITGLQRKKVGERLVFSWYHPCLGTHCWCWVPISIQCTLPLLLLAHRPSLQHLLPLLESQEAFGFPPLSTARDLRNWPCVLKTHHITLSTTLEFHNTGPNRLNLCFSDSLPSPQPKEIFNKSEMSLQKAHPVVFPSLLFG